MKNSRIMFFSDRLVAGRGTAMVGLMVIALYLTGCAKVPDTLITPNLSIETRNGEEYTLSLSAGLQNENSDIAFLNMKGDVIFYDPDRSGDTVLAVPFELPVVLPFDTGIIEVQKTYSEKEIMPLVNLMGSDREKLLSEKILERTFIEKNKIGLELSEYQKKKILDLLKDKIHEKN
jgi:hypothetical protein